MALPVDVAPRRWVALSSDSVPWVSNNVLQVNQSGPECWFRPQLFRQRGISDAQFWPIWDRPSLEETPSVRRVCGRKVTRCWQMRRKTASLSLTVCWLIFTMYHHTHFTQCGPLQAQQAHCCGIQGCHLRVWGRQWVSISLVHNGKLFISSTIQRQGVGGGAFYRRPT